MRDLGKIVLIILFAPLAFPALLLLPAGGEVMAEEQVAVGIVEDVILFPWGVRIPARIDTGAATSSLDARELTIKGDIAEFKLPDKYGGLQVSLPIVAWRTVRSAHGEKRRPVVEIELCLGPKRMAARVNLADRSGLTYPMIIGRNVLRKNFIVNCMKSGCASPVCPEAPNR